MHCFVVFLMLFSTLCNAPFGFGLGIKPSGFTSELIYRDSPSSPSGSRPSSRNAPVTSSSRTTPPPHSLSLESPESIIFPNSNGDYLMRIYIGTPRVERLVVADTRSNLVWVQCSPCFNCSLQDTLYYDPTKSLTFKFLQCESQPCTLLPPTQKTCGQLPLNQCLYSYNNDGESFTNGALVTDIINFAVDDIPSFPNSIAFGCGHHNQFTFIDPSGRTSGVVGLGAGPLSLVSQLGYNIGYKFSYCLVPYTSNTTSVIKFGNELATMSGNGVVSTPLIIKSPLPYYFLNLEGISIGQNTIQTADQTGGNIIIDSGTTYTFLELNFYNDFVTLLKETIGVEAVQNPPSPFSFCFIFEADQTNFPDVVFRFTGANVILMPINLLLPLDNNLNCLMVEPTSTVGGISVFGNRAQVDFQVGYDLDGKTVSFAPTDCTNY